MKEDTKKALRLMGHASALGIAIVLATAIGLALGYWLDRISTISSQNAVRNYRPSWLGYHDSAR
jgi:hypothetical protein